MRHVLTKKEAEAVCDILDELYPDAKAELNHRNEFELLIAVILSAQCTDVRVNIVTEPLFEEYPDVDSFLTLSEIELSEKIKTCGLYKSKSKNILSACRIIRDEYSGEVPRTIEQLMTLPGVGRKTANVVASNCFGIPAIAVDTHVFRVSNRIGLVNESTVEKTEIALMKKLPKYRWTKMHHNIIFHGRRVCKAKTPLCTQCALSEMCLMYKNGGRK